MPQSITELSPQSLWKHFYGITQVPRPSKKEEKILAHLKGKLEELGYAYRQDATGNIVVRKDATPGHENAPTVCIQGHVDMVCEKNKGTDHDFDNDPIKPFIDGEWVRAEGTTLGADNGIGVAAGLAVLESKDLIHPPMEFLFTVDEETGLTGAKQLQPDFLQSSILLNLDSEEDGDLYVGCAGGMDTQGVLRLTLSAPPPGAVALMIAVGGLRGGHSGLDINTGRGNAIKLLARSLATLRKDHAMHLSTINGGSKRNAIPREAECVVYVAENAVGKIQDRLGELTTLFRDELGSVEPNVAVEAKLTEGNGQVIEASQFDVLLNVLHALPHGVIKMSPDIDGLVQSSTNLATLVQDDGSLVIGTSQRSSIESEKYDVVQQVTSVMQLAQLEVTHGDGYPGWKPNMQSKALAETKEAYKELFGSYPNIKAIHAGLECGLIGSVYPQMDMISFGPTIVGAHSPDERVHIPAVERFWQLLVKVLERLA